jgi:hypothetical protein
MLHRVDMRQGSSERRRVLLVGFPEIRRAGLEPELRGVADTTSVCFPSENFEKAIADFRPHLLVVDVTYLNGEVVRSLFRFRLSDREAVIVYLGEHGPLEADDLSAVEGGQLVDASIAGLVALAAGGPLRLVGTTVHNWQRMTDPLNHGWSPAADTRRPGLCPKEELE